MCLMSSLQIHHLCSLNIFQQAFTIYLAFSEINVLFYIDTQKVRVSGRRHWHSPFQFLRHKLKSLIIYIDTATGSRHGELLKLEACVSLSHPPFR